MGASTHPSAPTAPLISRPRHDSASVRPKSPAHSIRVSRKYGPKSELPRCSKSRKRTPRILWPSASVLTTTTVLPTWPSSDSSRAATLALAALSTYHKVNLEEKSHKNDWNLAGVEGLPSDGQLDVSAFGVPALSMRIRTARNLKKFPLAGAMTQQDRLDMELAMGPVFDQLIANADFGGEYVSLSPSHPKKITDERYNELVAAHIMFKDMAADKFLLDAGIACHWPHGRGCYISEDKGFIIWLGEEDHLRIMA